MTNEELQAIRNRADKATEGDWEVMNGFDVMTELGATNREGISADHNDGWHIADCNVSLTNVDGELNDMSATEEKNNAIFIANARQDIPKLLAEVEMLRSELVKCQENLSYSLSEKSRLELALELIRGD